MIKDLRVTALVENTVRQPNLLAEHGLAFWIEADKHHILFDTGQGKVLLHNAQCLNIRLRAATKVVLSHGHFDHTGGLTDVLSTAGKVELYLHPAAMQAKYRREAKAPHRSVGIPGLDEQALSGRHRSLVWTREPTQLAEGIHVTGPIPRRNDFEDTGGPFFLDDACEIPDPLLDDQALYIDTSVGTVVILGCAHSGVVNTLDFIAELTGWDRIHAVLGGMHLLRATSQRLVMTVAALKRYGVRKIGAVHCTGAQATSYLRSQLPDACLELCTGSVFNLGK